MKRPEENVIFDDSERDDVDLGADFREENKWADAGRAFLREASEYQVDDPMDDEAPGPYERWSKENEYEDVLAHTPSRYLSSQELDDKANYYLDDPFDEPIPVPPSPLEQGPMGPMREPLTDFDEFENLHEEGEKLSPQAPGEYERPNTFFMNHKGVHEWYNDGRRNVTPPAEWLKRNPKHTNYQDVLRAHQKSQKPGTGVNPAANMKAGSN